MGYGLGYVGGSRFAGRPGPGSTFGSGKLPTVELCRSNEKKSWTAKINARKTTEYVSVAKSAAEGARQAMTALIQKNRTVGQLTDEQKKALAVPFSVFGDKIENKSDSVEITVNSPLDELLLTFSLAQGGASLGNSMDFDPEPDTFEDTYPEIGKAGLLAVRLAMDNLVDTSRSCESLRFALVTQPVGVFTRELERLPDLLQAFFDEYQREQKAAESAGVHPIAPVNHVAIAKLVDFCVENQEAIRELFKKKTVNNLPPRFNVFFEEVKPIFHKIDFDETIHKTSAELVHALATPDFSPWVGDDRFFCVKVTIAINGHQCKYTIFPNSDGRVINFCWFGDLQTADDRLLQKVGITIKDANAARGFNVCTYTDLEWMASRVDGLKSFRDFWGNVTKAVVDFFDVGWQARRAENELIFEQRLGVVPHVISISAGGVDAGMPSVTLSHTVVPAAVPVVFVDGKKVDGPGLFPVNVQKGSSWVVGDLCFNLRDNPCKKIRGAEEIVGDVVTAVDFLNSVLAGTKRTFSTSQITSVLDYEVRKKFSAEELQTHIESYGSLSQATISCFNEFRSQFSKSVNLQTQFKLGAVGINFRADFGASFGNFEIDVTPEKLRSALEDGVSFQGRDSTPEEVHGWLFGGDGLFNKIQPVVVSFCNTISTLMIKTTAEQKQAESNYAVAVDSLNTSIAGEKASAKRIKDLKKDATARSKLLNGLV
ncbi:MAG: hypothetical protein LBJ83_00265 [Oscillospiraceae bacterium]|jgi:hypothetical protein|nr:hypothetical protein [Oscillospiraceae bacterium]